jgi:hypothetical protein
VETMAFIILMEKWNLLHENVIIASSEILLSCRFNLFIFCTMSF